MRVLKHCVLAVLVSCFALTTCAAGNQADFSKVSCDSLSVSKNPAVVSAAQGLCHQIKSDAASQGLSLAQFAAKEKENGQYKQAYSNYAKQAYRANTPLGVTADAVSAQTCQGLCAGADAAMAIPIIGWIIAAALVGTAIGEGCDNCGGFQPV